MAASLPRPIPSHLFKRSCIKPNFLTLSSFFFLSTPRLCSRTLKKAKRTTHGAVRFPAPAHSAQKSDFSRTMGCSRREKRSAIPRCGGRKAWTDNTMRRRMERKCTSPTAHQNVDIALKMERVLPFQPSRSATGAIKPGHSSLSSDSHNSRHLSWTKSVNCISDGVPAASKRIREGPMCVPFPPRQNPCNDVRPVPLCSSQRTTRQHKINAVAVVFKTLSMATMGKVVGRARGWLQTHMQQTNGGESERTALRDDTHHHLPFPLFPLFSLTALPSSPLI